MAASVPAQIEYTPNPYPYLLDRDRVLPQEVFGWVEWQMGTRLRIRQYIPIANQDHWDLSMILSSDKKDHSFRYGMLIQQEHLQCIKFGVKMVQKMCR